MTLRFNVQQQVHSYKNGHSLAGASVKLGRVDQDLVDRLSDLAGPLGPGQVFTPYLTFYPLSSEPYFVVARTWQDLSAPRAGCVITRSLLVPLAVWREGGMLTEALRALEVEGPDLSRYSELELARQTNEIFPSLESTATTEFVEAFFLEKRLPIVMFDAASPEVFAARLMEGLWPGFRASLAVCTHAYSPRSIHGKPFDLIFSPSSARPNFSGWAGRKIDGLSSSRQPRHNWTSNIVQRLFETPRVVPLSVSFGELDVSSDDADESQFRLAMLWEELQQRAKESPRAVLGMLDIVSSLGRSGVSVSRLLGPIIRQSIQLARSLGTGELLQYLVTLLGKFPNRLPPTAALNEIRRSASDATSRDPGEAVAFLRRLAEENSTPPAVVVAGIADGIAKEETLRSRLDEILDLSDEALLSLLGYGRKFAKKLVETLESANDAGGFTRLERLVSTADVSLRARARRNIVPSLKHSGEARLLAALLREADSRALASSVRWLSASGGLEIPELGAALMNAADSSTKAGQLRLLIGQLPESAAIDSLLARTLPLTETDLDWLMSSRFEPSRSSVILREALSITPDADLRRLPLGLADTLAVAARFEEGDWGDGKLVRILSLLPCSCDALLRIVFALPRAYGHELDSTPEFAHYLLSRLLAEKPEQELAARALERFARGVSARELVLMATSPKVKIEQLSANLLMFDAASQVVRRHVASRVDVLTEQIVARRHLVPSIEAVGAWAALISEESRHGNESLSLRAASVALEFALKSTQVQVSPLLRVAFPLVHAHLRNSQDTPSMMGFFSFHDWDRCKTARKDLVRAFLLSVWPPADLLKIADEVSEVDSFVWILSKSLAGRELLTRALADPTLPPYVRNEFEARR